MAKKATIAVDNVVEDNNSSVTRAEYDALIEKNNKLEKMLEQLLSKSTNENTGAQSIDKMDKPVTLIHLVECDPMLPTTFIVNGTMHYFTSFGETKVFRWSDMSNIISKYRSWFVRGVFALGKDSEEFKYEIPSDITALKLPDGFFSRMISMDIDEFKHHFSNITENQKLQIAQVWNKRFNSNIPGYNNVEKIKFINKETDGMLKNVLDKLNNY